MARLKVKPAKPPRTQGSGAKGSGDKREDPRRKSRRGHSRLPGGKPRSPSLR
jgi:hypothetical protein